MRLLRFFVRLSGPMAALIAAVSLLSGVCNTALLALLHRALGGEGSLAFLALAFSGVALAKVATSLAGDVLLIRFAARTLGELRDAVARDVLRAPLRQVERLGSGRVIALLTEDIDSLNEAYLSLPYLGSQAAMLVGGAAYLGWLSPPTLLGLVAFSGVALLAQRAALRRSRRRLEQARASEDRLLALFYGLTDGLKQLKLHRERRESYLREDIARTSRESLGHRVASDVGFTSAEHFTQLALYCLLALLLFAVPALTELSRQALTGYVLTIVFLLGPFRALLGGYGRVVAAQVSVERLEGLTDEVRALAEAADLPPVPALDGASEDSERRGEPIESVEAHPVPRSVSAPGFERIDLRGIRLAYEPGAGFELGPISASLERGQVVFVTGGNGSGKTSLVKILCGLYEPDGGQVLWDGHVVGRDRLDEYRQLFSAVFADHHLFDRAVGERATDGAFLGALLERFELRGRLTPVEGRFPDLNLSRGQRARLALVFALVEDRPIYVFDEWAAEQDPIYRRRFYEEFVPELKERGKTVVVITHDDRFFHLADRVWHFNEGGMVERTPESAPVAAGARA